MKIQQKSKLYILLTKNEIIHFFLRSPRSACRSNILIKYSLGMLAAFHILFYICNKHPSYRNCGQNVLAVFVMFVFCWNFAFFCNAVLLLTFIIIYSYVIRSRLSLLNVTDNKYIFYNMKTYQSVEFVGAGLPKHITDKLTNQVQLEFIEDMVNVKTNTVHLSSQSNVRILETRSFIGGTLLNFLL